MSDPRVKQVSFIKLKKFLAGLGSVDEDVSSASPPICNILTAMRARAQPT